MTDKIKKQDQQMKAACFAGLDAVVKRFGKNASQEQMLDVVILMAHNLLTHGERLDINLSAHNGSVFCDRLKQLIELTQKDIAENGSVGRLM